MMHTIQPQLLLRAAPAHDPVCCPGACQIDPGTMNFFGGSSPPSANNQQLKMAKAEVKMYSDLFNK